MTPTERAARALARQHGGLLSGTGPSSPEAEEHASRRWRDYEQDVRTVLEAIRVPAPRMIIAGREATERDGEAVDLHDIHMAFVAMIDAALADAPGD